MIFHFLGRIFDFFQQLWLQTRLFCQFKDRIEAGYKISIAELLDRYFFGSLDQSLNLFVTLFPTFELVYDINNFLFHRTVAFSVRNSQALPMLIISVGSLFLVVLPLRIFSAQFLILWASKNMIVFKTDAWYHILRSFKD